MPQPSTYDYNMIYVYSIDDAKHRGLLKVGMTTVEYFKNWKDLKPNCEELNNAAHERILEDLGTAAVDYNLEYTEIGTFERNAEEYSLTDHDVHDVLENSGYQHWDFGNPKYKAKEWFPITLDKAIKAIEAVKDNQNVLEKEDWQKAAENDVKSIDFRKEQIEAIGMTLDHFRNGSKMLWNAKMLWDAKMRFGKTLCALEVVNRASYDRVLILTHRPAVRDGWHEDFEKLRLDGRGYHYITRKKGKLHVDGKKVAGGLEVLKAYREKDKDYKYIYFASIQDLRGSKKVNKKSQIDKNNELFAEQWDLLILDEAHEGIRTALGKNVVSQFQEDKNLKTLYLSGTPYNILHLFSDDEIYRWDYIKEQEAKAQWYIDHPNENNPYEGLAELRILTYNLGDVFKNYSKDDNDYFSFTEFFRVEGEDGKEHFAHEKDVRAFLHLMTKDGDNKELNYPFATNEYRDYFQHTLWLLPGVKEALCLQRMLNENDADNGFKDYFVVNVAGDGSYSDMETEDVSDAVKKETEALGRVKAAIKSYPKTITLSCGRLTTGVSVPEWTAVMMLAGSYETKASRYLQTIFRAQTPMKGAIKRHCYAFDFAPDRTLTVIDEYITHLSKDKSKSKRNRELLDKFLKFCPVIALDGSKTVKYDTKSFISQVNRAYSDHIIQHGCRDKKLFVNLNDITDEDFNLLLDVDSKMQSASSGKKSSGKVEISRSEMDGADTRASNNTQEKEHSEKPKKPKQEQNRGDQAYAILEKISIRFPMLIYGSLDKVDDSFNIKSFVESIDEESWVQFMPGGLKKEAFLQLIHLLHEDRFMAVVEHIHSEVKALESLSVDARVNQVAQIISNFRYPDRETILTPWSTVNMHLSDTIGGYDFYEENHQFLLREPRFVNRGEVTKEVFLEPDTKILELNSKTGLYPLYMAYTIYRIKCEKISPEGNLSNNEKLNVWKNVVENNIFVVCMTDMAAKITIRTLVGYADIKVNAKVYRDKRNDDADIVITLKKNQQNFISDVTDGKTYWKANNISKMKFNAIVSNPPYGKKDGGNAASAVPMYHLFLDAATELLPKYVSMIMPSRWLYGGRNLDKFRSKMLNDDRFSILHDYYDENECFKNVEIKGGVCYLLWDEKHHGNCVVNTHHKGKVFTSTRPLLEDGVETFIRSEQQIAILYKVRAKGEEPLSNWLNAGRFYGFHTKVEWNEDGQTGTIQTADGSDVIPILRNKVADDDVKIYIHGGSCWIHRTDIPKNEDKVDSYKVLLPRSGNPKTIIIGKPKISEPGTCCSNTYVIASNPEFNLSQQEAENLLGYMKTKFFRFLVATKTSTQSMSLPAYTFVPLQDFKKSWSDKDLYDRYNLEKSERDYIESMMMPMDNKSDEPELDFDDVTEPTLSFPNVHTLTISTSSTPDINIEGDVNDVIESGGTKIVKHVKDDKD